MRIEPGNIILRIGSKQIKIPHDSNEEPILSSRQIEVRALRKLRYPSHLRQLRDFLKSCQKETRS